MMNSRTRISEYVVMFASIDELRIQLLKKIKDMTLENIDKQDSEQAQAEIDVLTAKVDFVNDIAANIINAFMENETLNGN